MTRRIARRGIDHNMCSRFYYAKDFYQKLNNIAELDGYELKLENDLTDVHPSETSITLFQEGNHVTAKNMLWGFTSNYDKSLVINARSESVREKPMFSESIALRRCIIPASGFYEWDANKARYRFFMPEGGLILMAGIYRNEPTGNRYTILTTDANETMAPVHNRMPVIISEDEIRPWLRDDTKTDEILNRVPGLLAKEQDAGQISMVF